MKTLGIEGSRHIKPQGAFFLYLFFKKFGAFGFRGVNISGFWSEHYNDFTKALIAVNSVNVAST
jgi:hypothetical protein